MFNLNLKGNKAYQWTNENDIWFIGYCFDDQDKHLTGVEALKLVGSCISSNKKINGIYTYIIVSTKSLKVYTDTVNFFPIFYFSDNLDWCICDSWDEAIKIKGEYTPNSDAEIEFANAGFVLGNNTLDSEILKTKASELTVLSENRKVFRTSTFDFIPESFIKNDFANLSELTNKQFEAVGRRIKEFIGNRIAVLPLSGGFDSRLIACLLKKQNIENVICFTYGKMNPEVNISKAVAEKLGYKWHFIDYSEIEIEGYLDDENFIEYAKANGNGFAMPYLQEYFAVKYLSENNLIPANSVFLPGHSGDYLGGSYIEKTIKTELQNDQIANYIAEKYFVFTNTSQKDKGHIASRINSTLDKYPKQNLISKSYNPYIEDWDIKEKLSKFIFHSSFVFSYFGYEHLFPLWDRELVDFFREVPFEQRERKILYDTVAIESYFIPHGVSFNKEELNKSYLYKSYQKQKDKIRYLFPWHLVQKRMIKSDWINYYYISSFMENQLVEKGYSKLKNYKFFNAVICKWYLDFIGFYDK